MGMPAKVEKAELILRGLASEVDDNMLFNAFLPYRCITARAIRDINARRTKGYGFVEFE